MEIYNTERQIASQWEFAVWLGELQQGLGDRPKGGLGRVVAARLGRGGRLCRGLILADAWRKTTKFYKAITLQCKKKKSVYYITYFEIPGCFIKSHNCQLNIILSIFLLWGNNSKNESKYSNRFIYLLCFRMCYSSWYDKRAAAYDWKST